MKHIFQGRKKYITIPVGGLLGLFFLPITILVLLFFLTKNKVQNIKRRNTIQFILIMFSLPFVLGYLSAFTTPQKTNTLQSAPVLGVETSQPTPTASPIPVFVESTPREAVMETTIAKPSTTPTPVPITTPHPTIKPTAQPTKTPTPTVTYKSSYTCDCSRTCTEISSCAEAQYQLNVCGCRVRDNDHDGIACDSAPLHCQN